MLDDLRSKITDTFPKIPDVDFQVKYVPESMQDYLSPAFYMIPAIDNLTENVIYINNGQTASGLISTQPLLTKAIPDICTRPSIFLLLSRILFGAFLILADTLRAGPPMRK